jgi:hypothetical protein
MLTWSQLRKERPGMFRVLKAGRCNYTKTDTIGQNWQRQWLFDCLKNNGAPGVIRTPGTRFRKPLLYPPELQGRLQTISNFKYRNPKLKKSTSKSNQDEIASARNDSF